MSGSVHNRHRIHVGLLITLFLAVQPANCQSPNANIPLAEKTVAENPVAKKSVTEKPVAEKSVTEKPLMDTSATTDGVLKTEISIFSQPDTNKETYVPSLPDLFLPLQTIDSVALPAATNVTGHKLFERLKIMTGMGLGFQGFDPSKEGADTILGEKVHQKTDFAYNYSRIHRIDEKHRQTVSAIMELAVGIGMPDSPHSRVVRDSALAELQETAGAEIAADVLGDLQSLKSTFAYNKPTLPEINLTIKDRNALLQQVVDTVSKQDPIIAHIKTQLHKYNTRSQFSQNSAKVIETALNIAGFVPTLVAPIAGVSSFAFTSATGGPEQEKLLREVYLAKSLEDRQQVIEDDAHLILDTYLIAVASNNATLFSCSRSLLSQLCPANNDIVCQVFGGSPPTTAPQKKFTPYTPSEAFQPYSADGRQFKPAM